MCTQALGVCTMPAASTSVPVTLTPSIRPPVAMPEVCRKVRRDTPPCNVVVVMAFSRSGLAHLGGRGLDRGADARVGAAAAEVAAHRGVDVGVARVLVLRQQRGRA